MILAMSSANNEQRQPAEAAYNETKSTQPGFLVQALIEVGCNSTNTPAALLALVLLRKNFSDLWASIEGFDEEQRKHIQNSLLTRFGDPNTPHNVRKATASAIANLAAKLSQNGRNAWPQLWELLLRTAGDEGANAALRAMCLEVFAQVATVLVTTYFAPQLPQLVEMLSKCMSHGDAALRTKAMECVAEFVHVCESAQMPLLRQTAISMVNGYAASCRAGDSDEAMLQSTHIRNIIEESDYTYFQDVYPPLLEAMYNCASNNSLDSDARHMAIGCIMSLGGKCKAVKNNSAFVKKVFDLLFQYMLHPEMDADWEATYEKEEDEEKTTDFDAGAQGCDRLAHIIKGKAMEQLAAPCIMQNVSSDNWKARAAALTLLTYVFEGAAKSFVAHLDMIVKQVIVPRISDPHPYVRYCAIQCVAQLSSDLCPAFQEKYGGLVLPLVAEKLAGSTPECPRIMTLAACTINTFFDELDNSKPDDEEEDNRILPEEQRYASTRFADPFLQPVCGALFTALQGPKPVFVHSECLAALSSVIQLYEARVKPFTDQIVQCCGHFLQYAGTGPDATLIRCRAIECTTLTGSYVGKQFFPQSHQVCTYLLDLLESGLEQNDMRLRYVLRGWTCMVECLGPDVLQYLSKVMRPLLNIAQSNVDAERIEKEVGDEELQDTDEIKHVRICVPGKGEQILRMHTGLIEDKDLAVTILLNFTEELKGAMHPYLGELTNTALPLLKFQAMSETRESAAEMLRSLVTVVEKSDERNNLDQYICHVVPALFEAIDEEAEQGTVQVMLGALSGILSKASPGILPDGIAVEAARMMHEIYELSVKSIEQLQTENAEDEEEKEEKDGAIEEEADLLQDCATCIGQLLRIVPTFNQIFEERFLPMTATLLNPAHEITHHKIAIHLLCEFVEHSQNVAAHLPNAVNTFMGFAQHADPDVAQAAMFGLCMTVEAAAKLPRSENIATFINNTSSLTRRFLSHGNAKIEDWLGVTINCVSAALRIIKHFGDAVDAHKLFESCANHFPISEEDDEVEAARIHDLLAQWCCTPDHPILGAQSPYRQRTVQMLKGVKYMSDQAREAVSKL